MFEVFGQAPDLVFRDGGEDHVGLYGGDLDAFDGGESIGEEAGVRVVFGQAVDVVLEGVNAGRSQDARLAHAATEHFPPASGFLHEISGAGQNGTDGTPEAFGKAYGNRIERSRDLDGGNSLFYGGVEDTGAVEVQGEPMLVGKGLWRRQGTSAGELCPMWCFRGRAGECGRSGSRRAL